MFNDLFTIGKIVLDLGEEERATYHPGAIVKETVTTHTVMLGAIACDIAKRLGWTEHAIGQVAIYSNVHDMLESYCGDTNSFDLSDEGREAKEGQEALALVSLCRDLGDDHWLAGKIKAYERQFDVYSRLVRYIDKATPKITHTLNNCATMIEQGVSLDDMARAHTKQLAELTEKYPEFTGTVAQEFLIWSMWRSEQSYPKEDL